MSECRVCESTPKVQPVYHQSAGPFAQVAQFSFTLPPAEQMGELLPWMQAAMHMVDQLGSYKLKPDQKVRLSLDQTFLQMASGPVIIGYLMRIMLCCMSVENSYGHCMQQAVAYNPFCLLLLSPAGIHLRVRLWETKLSASRLSLGNHSTPVQTL